MFDCNVCCRKNQVYLSFILASVLLFSNILHASTIERVVDVNVISLQTSVAGGAGVNIHIGVANQDIVIQPGYIYYTQLPTLFVDGSPVSQAMSLALTSALSTGRQMQMTFDETCIVYNYFGGSFQSCYRTVKSLRFE